MGATSEHFTDGELRCKGRDCCGRVNECKPKLLAALENLRALVGRPITIISAYRCPKHNAAIGGAPKSQHVDGIAADIRVEGMTAVALEKIAATIPAIGGIGRDDFGQDLHIDVRTTPARWCYDAQGKTISYYPAVPAVQST